ncbi:NrsF family protein [Rhizobium leguminosarum]|uniref:NrsF family protein n=1 Tax=Rhizobium leguminosarum TaxID=384 RepID=UPI0019F066E4|nr:hypothetical protein [Rhizobium leguminosarum bv. viciae]
MTVELYVVPSSAWTGKLIGHNALHSDDYSSPVDFPGGTPLFFAMPHGAPAHPGIAGAVAGLASAGIAGDDLCFELL